MSIFRSNVIASAHGSEDDVQACNVFTQPVDTLDEASKRLVLVFRLISRSFASKYHISKILYADGLEVYLPEPLYDLSDVENVYRSSTWYRQQRSMLYLASDLLRNASIPLLLSYGSLKELSFIARGFGSSCFPRSSIPLD